MDNENLAGFLVLIFVIAVGLIFLARWFDSAEKRVQQQSKQMKLPQERKSAYEVGTSRFLPQVFSEAGVLADFWQTIFGSAAELRGEFEKRLSAGITKSGVAPTKNAISFTKGELWGKVRPFYLVERNNVVGVLYIGLVGEDLKDIYVSIRMMLKAEISFLRAAGLWLLCFFVAVFPALFPATLLWYQMGFTEDVYTYDAYSLNYRVSGQVLALDRAGMAYLVALVGTMVALRIVSFIWCAWQYGDGVANVRAEPDELARDDIAALGDELYLAVTEVADELDLKRLLPEPEQAPTFGANVQTNRSARKRRI